MILFARMSQHLIVIFAFEPNFEAQPFGLKCHVEVEGRPPIATHSCCSLLKQYNAKSVGMLLHQSLCLQHVSFCARGSLALIAILTRTKAQAQL